MGLVALSGPWALCRRSAGALLSRRGWVGVGALSRRRRAAVAVVAGRRRCSNERATTRGERGEETVVWSGVDGDEGEAPLRRPRPPPGGGGERAGRPPCCRRCGVRCFVPGERTCQGNERSEVREGQAGAPPRGVCAGPSRRGWPCPRDTSQNPPPTVPSGRHRMARDSGSLCPSPRTPVLPRVRPCRSRAPAL